MNWMGGSHKRRSNSIGLSLEKKRQRQYFADRRNVNYQQSQRSSSNIVLAATKPSTTNASAMMSGSIASGKFQFMGHWKGKGRWKGDTANEITDYSNSQTASPADIVERLNCQSNARSRSTAEDNVDSKSTESPTKTFVLNHEDESLDIIFEPVPRSRDDDAHNGPSGDVLHIQSPFDEPNAQSGSFLGAEDHVESDVSSVDFLIHKFMQSAREKSGYHSTSQFDVH